MRLLVYGASGYIGQKCVRAALKRNWSVVGVYRTLDDNACGIDQHNKYTRQTYESVRGNFDVVLSCIGARTGDPAECEAVDAQMNIDLIKTSRPVHKYVLLSGACVETPRIPLQFAKLKSEKALIDSTLPFTIVRPTCYYKCFYRMLSKPKINTFSPGVDFHPIDGDDLAEEIINICEDEAVNNIISIGGNFAYNMETIVTQYKSNNYSMWNSKFIDMALMMPFIPNKIRNTLETIRYYNSYEMKFDKTIETCTVKEYMDKYTQQV